MAFHLTRAVGAPASAFHAKAATATIQTQLIAVAAGVTRSARQSNPRLPARWPLTINDLNSPEIEQITTTRDGGSGLSHANDIVGLFDRPGTGPPEATIEPPGTDFRGYALGFRTLANYIAKITP